MASRYIIVLLACVSAALANPCGGWNNGLIGNGLIGNGLGLGLGNGLGLGLGGLGLGNGLVGGPILGNGLLGLGAYGNLPIATGFGNAGLIGTGLNGVAPDAIIAPHAGPQIHEIIHPVPNPYAATFAPTLIPVTGPIVGPTGHIGVPSCGGPVEIMGPIAPAVEFVAPVANNVFWGNNWNNANGWNNCGCGGVVGPVITQAGVPVLNQIAAPAPVAAVAPGMSPFGLAGWNGAHW